MTRYLLLAIGLAITSFVFLRLVYQRSKAAPLRAALVLFACFLTTPSLMFLCNYILNTPSGNWFYYYHSLPGIESSSGLVGALLGVVTASINRNPRWVKIPILIVSILLAMPLIMAPFAKKILYKLDYSTLENRWTKGICKQSSPSTCVPASCATVIKLLGGNVSERELAIEAGTTRRGTELWYMMRSLRKHGFQMNAYAASSLKDAPTPCILGVKVGRAGHVVVMISKNAAGPEIGDPSGIRKHYTWAVFERGYHPNNQYFCIRPLTTAPN